VTHTKTIGTTAPIIEDTANIGLAVRTLKEFFNQRKRIKAELKENFTFFVSFFQLYNEKIFDLLTRKSGKQDLKMRFNEQENFVVDDLTTVECETLEEALVFYHMGVKNKIVSSHKMNHASSRSHCVFSFQVIQHTQSVNSLGFILIGNNYWEQDVPCRSGWQ